MDRIWDRECGNGREGEAIVWCNDCFARTSWDPWQDVVIGGGLWGFMLGEGDLELK